MKVKCRKCQIIFDIPGAMPSDIEAMNKALCGSGFGTPFHEVRGVTGVNSMIFIDPKEWEKIDDKTGFNLFIVYKRPSKKRF